MLLQNMIYRRLRAGFGATWGTWVVAGALFALAHLPNPVLVPATLVWGAVSARLFERWSSVIAIALLQTLLSGLLYWMAPLRLSHEFRVGPGPPLNTLSIFRAFSKVVEQCSSFPMTP